MNEKARNARPVARKQGLVIQELPDEVLVYDLILWQSRQPAPNRDTRRSLRRLRNSC